MKELIPVCVAEPVRENHPDLVEAYLQRALKLPCSKDTAYRQSDAVMNWNACRKIKKITAPTLIIHGKEDKLISVKNAEFLAKKIPGAKTLILENSGHIILGEDQEIYHQTIIEFLES